MAEVPGFGPLGEVVGRGARADVHSLGDGWVLKLYWAGTDPSGVEAEARATALLHGLGLAVPACYGTVTVQGRPGIVFERVEGPTLAHLIAARPWLSPRFARTMAELQVSLHDVPGRPEWTSQRAELVRRIRSAPQLEDRVRAAAEAALERLPDGSSLCHGDFHPGNILCGRKGPVVIDWQDPSRGSPAADVARTVLLLLGGPRHLPGRLQRILTIGLVRLGLPIYLRRYRRLRPLSLAEVRAWLPVLAAARLCEGILEEEAWLLGLAARLARPNNASRRSSKPWAVRRRPSRSGSSRFRRRTGPVGGTTFADAPPPERSK